ncbi:hypothetical protein G6O69_31760 [Pseudenhygromyxa sp. WMMC2535]|uniref:hypothetical protein n=1 Tax=Pseudenhygromyxa sp. WMMC2535 TaxID=2712867 RepID=UPI00155318FE|nr:hypothetical protein [Pseudenhygromyxa sp. WMMC2535]NVB42443.1 hypothetical protein [Pseudenhygromyxa sp. WMMC2535]
MSALPQAPARLALLLAPLALSACPDDKPKSEPEWTIGEQTDESVGAFLSVWGPSRDEVYAVGGNPEAGAMVRFDGEGWVEAEIPADMPLINWVYGTGSDLWIAGNEGTVGHRAADGSWTSENVGTSAALWGIWGSSATDVWTVGGDIPGDAPVLAHFDGSAWSLETLPDADREFDALLKVWGTGPDNVFAVGHQGVIFHYDGDAWVQQPSGVTRDLISLWGTGPDEIVAVGGRSNGVIARYDGEAWTSEVIGELPGLNGVWVAEDGTATSVGVDGVVIEVAPGGFEWTLLDRSVRPNTLHGSFGLADGARFGVGGSLLFSPPWSGVIVQYLP